MAEAATLEGVQIFGETETLARQVQPLHLGPALLDVYVDEAAAYVPLDALPPVATTVRPPEAEIYGRSLSTPHKFGVFVVGEVISEAVKKPEAEQARAEFRTSVEEGLGTDREHGGALKVRTFDRRPVLGGKVMAKDLKTAISDMTLAGLINAEEKFKRESAIGDFRFAFQLTRSRRDHPNALICDAMARGETDFNTLMAITPFPEEAEEECGARYVDGIGYVSPFKRGFVQIYHAGKEYFLSGSLSFDGSNKKRLRELFAGRDIEIPEDETTDNWLKYAITGNFTEEEAKALALELADEAGDPKYKKTANTVDITTEHEKIMDTIFEESYVHACESLALGYQTPGVQQLILQLANKAGSFNARYRQALYRMRANANTFTDDDMIVLHELLVYSTIEMMRALHIGTAKPTHHEPDGFLGNLQPNPAYLQALDQASFQSMLAGFGAEGARNNRAYTACGLEIAPGGDPSNPESPQYAFGGVGKNIDSTSGDEDKYGSLEFDCPKCKRTNRRPRGKLIPHCQKCGADVTCG